MSSPLSPELAASQEDLFLSRVREAMAAGPEIRDPVSGETVAFGRRPPVECDDAVEIRRKMATLGAHDPALLERLPRNRQCVCA